MHRFMQVCHFLTSCSFPSWPSIQETFESVRMFPQSLAPPADPSKAHLHLFIPKMAFKHICLHSPSDTMSGTISAIYSFLSMVGPPQSSPTYISLWEHDFENPIDHEECSKAWSTIAKCSSNTMTLEAAYNVLLRLYWFPTCIAHANPSYSDRCFRGYGVHGAVLYTWWTCRGLTRFWSRTFGPLHNLFHLSNFKDAKLALLHCPSPGLFSYQQKVATCLFLVAKHIWPRSGRNTWSLCSCERLFDHYNEKMSSILHDFYFKFLKYGNNGYLMLFPHYTQPIMAPCDPLAD